jgi:hypothetical protein
VTGQQAFNQATGSGNPLDFKILGYGVLAVLVCGGLCALIGLALFAPMRSRRPLASIALIASLVMVAAAAYYLIKIQVPISEVVKSAGVGAWCFLLGGVVALLGSLKAVASR